MICLVLGPMQLKTNLLEIEHVQSVVYPLKIKPCHPPIEFFFISLPKIDKPLRTGSWRMCNDSNSTTIKNKKGEMGQP